MGKVVELQVSTSTEGPGPSGRPVPNEPTDDDMKAIVAARAQIDSQVQAAEAARNRADSESAFAFNAKKNAEEHASFIAQTRGQVEAQLAWLNATRKNAEDAAQAIASARTSAESTLQAATDARSAAERDVAKAVGLCASAETASLAAQKAQADVLSAQQATATVTASIAAAKGTVEAALAAIQASQAAASTHASALETEAAASEARARDSKASLSDVATVLASLKEAHAAVERHEQELETMKGAFATTTKKLEGLLPHATSAGLASAFREQKLRFATPLKAWIAAFVGALLALLAAGLIRLQFDNASWDSILRHFAQRLPLVAPLVWLALYAGRNFMLTQRIHEEYAYKEAVSTAFEGYKREMSEVTLVGSGDHPPPIVALCDIVLRTLALQPGRIYEGKHEDITPLGPLTRAVTEAVPAINALSGKGLAAS